MLLLLFLLLQQPAAGMDHCHRMPLSRSVPPWFSRIMVLVPTAHDGQERYAFRYSLLGAHIALGTMLHAHARSSQCR
jgi:hypothetical protein